MLNIRGTFNNKMLSVASYPEGTCAADHGAGLGHWARFLQGELVTLVDRIGIGPQLPHASSNATDLHQLPGRRRTLGRRGPDQALSTHLGDDAVYLDWRSIPHGIPFDRTLLHAVRTAAVLLVVIGDRWLQTGADGIRWLDRTEDWVRREIVAALTTGTTVIPVLVGDVPALHATELPTNIRRLAKCQSVRLRHRDAPRDLAHIVGIVRNLLTAVPPATATAP
jgi:TIR domain-containing protein